MPHLSPMSWSLSPLTFFTVLMILMSSMWWVTLPKFSASDSTQNNILLPNWKWS